MLASVGGGLCGAAGEGDGVVISGFPSLNPAGNQLPNFQGVGTPAETGGSRHWLRVRLP